MHEKISGKTIVECNAATLNKDDLMRGSNSIDISKGLASQQYKSNKRKDVLLDIPKEYLKYI